MASLSVSPLIYTMIREIIFKMAIVKIKVGSGHGNQFLKAVIKNVKQTGK